MVLPTRAAPAWHWFANTKGHARRQIPEFSARSFEGYVNARVLTEAGRAGPRTHPRQAARALASVRSHDMGRMTVDYSNGAPYVGSRFVDLGILGANGRMVG